MRIQGEKSGMILFALSPQSERVIKSALQMVLGQALDELARAKHQKEKDPNWKSGTGKTIDVTIEESLAWVERTQQALDELEMTK